jgi:hypothetical protein
VPPLLLTKYTLVVATMPTATVSQGSQLRALADRITGTISELVEASERETGLPNTTEGPSLLVRLQSVASTLGISMESPPSPARHVMERSHEAPAASPPTQLRSGVMDRPYRPAPTVVQSCEDESLHTAGGVIFSMRRAWVLRVARGEAPLSQVNPALWVAYRMFVDQHLLVGKTTTTGFHTYAVSRALAVVQNPLGFSGTCATA